MKKILDELAVQRWDDHRYYHHSRINQSLHLLSACSFLVSTPCLASMRSTATSAVEAPVSFSMASGLVCTRAKSNTKFKRRYSNPVDRANSNIVCDQTGVLTVFYSSKDYPATLRRVVVKNHNGKRITFLTNNFALKPELIADLYRQRWQVELFFKWIKQHLRIKTFYGTNENAVKTQIWIAVCTYVLIAIAKKRLHLPNSLHEILQILSLTMFEITPMN